MAQRDQYRIPIIALTAHAMIGDRDKSIQAGMNDHVTKPLDPEELFKVLVKWIEPREQPLTLSPVGTQTPAPTSKAPSLPYLSGIDTDAALARVGGNRNALVRLINKFCQGHKADVTLIAEVLKSGETPKAQEAAHTLKGVAGTIGAVALHQTAARLVTAVKQQDTKAYAPLLASAEKLLNQVFDAGNQLADYDTDDVQPQTNRETSFPLNKEKITAALADIRQHLQNRSFKSAQQIKLLERLLPESTAYAELRALKKLAERYRFKDALKALDNLADML